MTIRVFHYTLAYLLLYSAMGAITADAAAAGEEAGFRFRLVVDAPSWLSDTLQNGLDISRWQTYENMTQPLLQSLAREARVQALEAAATEGYYNAQVDITIEEARRGMRNVRLQVKPGKPVRVGNVSIALRGTQDPGAEARVRAQWSLTKGEIFRQAAWETEKNRALAELAREKYVGAAIAESRAIVDPVRNTADLTLVLDPGPPFAFGQVTVTGLSKYPEETVTHLVPFKPGDPYTREHIEVFLRRLNATNYFASAQAIVDDNPDLAGAAPVHVSVMEAPTRRLEVGIGFNTDTLYRATAAWRDVNLFDSAWRFRSELRLESKLQRLGATVNLPARSDGWADSVEAAGTRTDIENLVTRGAVVEATRRSLDERRQPAFGLSNYYEEQRPEGAPVDFVRALLARYEYTRRSTDDFLFPRSGTVATLRLGASIPGISTEVFGRALSQLAWFYPFSRSDDFTVRGELGAVLRAAARRGSPRPCCFAPAATPPCADTHLRASACSKAVPSWAGATMRSQAPNMRTGLAKAGAWPFLPMQAMWLTSWTDSGFLPATAQASA